MDTYLKFTNQTDANNAANKIWYNYIMSVANNSEKIVGNVTNHYFLSDLQNMTEEEVTPLKIYGKKRGVIQYTEGVTDCYVIPHECNNEAGSYVFIKPEVDLMSGVINYTEESKNLDWWPPAIDVIVE